MQVKFIKGTIAQYNAKATEYSGNGTIFFATDDNIIYANGVAYGISKEDQGKLSNSVKAVTLNEADNTIKIEYTDTTKAVTFVTIAAVSDTNNGLMTPTQKANLETVYADVVTGGADTTKNKIAENKVGSTGKTINVTSGETKEDGSIVGTNLEVNIDGKTIVKDEATGQISVVSGALVQYVGDEKTVEISDAVDGKKTVKVIAKLKEITEGLASNVEKAYAFVDADGNEIADSSRILVYKDASFVRSFVGHMDDTIDAISGEVTDGTGAEALVEVRKNANGEYTLTKINWADHLREGEFKAGLKVENGNVSVKLSETEESKKYLQFQKIDGENEAIQLTGIDAAIKKASTTVTEKTTGHVTVTVTDNGENGKTVEVAEDDIASAQDLTDEVTRAKDAEAALDKVLGTTKATDGEGRTYSNTGTYIGKKTAEEGGNTIASDIKALDEAIKSLGGDSLTNIEVNGVEGTVTNNKAVVTVKGSDIKVASTSETGTLFNTGGVVKDNDTIEYALKTIEAMLLWYEA